MSREEEVSHLSGAQGKERGRKGTKKESRKKWFHPDLNRGPSLRQSDVITNYTMKPLNTRALKRNIIPRGVEGEKREKDKTGCV